jgi:hypothetical protein
LVLFTLIRPRVDDNGTTPDVYAEYYSV